ncbi:MAG: hypothetical protein K2Y37_06015 [Pirellulales bacterium]|nr:hypothetical protein [Pirellulales bacterium]
MRVVDVYSHKGGEAFIRQRHGAELAEVYKAVEATSAAACLRKLSKEKTKPPLIFHPESLNLAIKSYLTKLGWTEPAPKSKKGFREPRINLGQREFREMDGIKNKVGLEVQFGKYAFMGYDIFSKMPIFANRGLIECGIEIVAIQSMLRDMSTGVSSFSQIVMDMGARGEADVDIPTLILGIGPTDREQRACARKRRRFADATERERMLQAGEIARGRQGALPGPKGAAGLYTEPLRRTRKRVR